MFKAKEGDKIRLLSIVNKASKNKGLFQPGDILIALANNMDGYIRAVPNNKEEYYNNINYCLLFEHEYELVEEETIAIPPLSQPVKYKNTVGESWGEVTGYAPTEEKVAFTSSFTETVFPPPIPKYKIGDKVNLIQGGKCTSNLKYTGTLTNNLVYTGIPSMSTLYTYIILEVVIKDYHIWYKMSDYDNWVTEEGLRLVNDLSVIKETEWIPSVEDFVTVTTPITVGTGANKLIGKTFQVEKVSVQDGGYGKWVTGAKTTYPHLFSLTECGVYVKELRKATENEILLFLLKKKEPCIKSENLKQTSNISGPFYETQKPVELYILQGSNVLNTNIINTRSVTEQLLQKKNNFLF